MRCFCVYFIVLTLFCKVFVFSTFINFLDLKKTWNSTRNTAKNNRSTTGVNNKYGTPLPAGDRCTCKPLPQCSAPPQDNTPPIDIRIVTNPSGLPCGPGAVYCCYTNQKKCGNKSMVPVKGISLRPGQAQYGEYPWQAIIESHDNDYIGSGALIDNLHILTVAHRIAQYEKVDLIVRLGDWDLLEDIEPLKVVDVRVANVLVHPEYNSKTLKNDIAILKLDQAVSTFPHIQPVCLPAADASFIGNKCWVSGWGKDMFGHQGNYQNIQKHIDVTILDDTVCETQLRSTRLGSNYILDRQSFICAGGETGKDACTGDGGSPLVCERLGNWYLVGLVAWGIGCAQANVPGVYVDVINHMPWITQCIR